MRDYLGHELSHDLSRAIHRLRLRTVKEVRETPETRTRLEKSLDVISKAYGEDVLAPIKLLEGRHDVQCVSTGFQEFDDVLSGHTERINGVRKWIPGTGRGVPRARIIEIFGPESSGKTTLTLMLVRAFQERGLRCAFIDAEHALDMDYADNIGCDTESWYYSQGGESAEETLDMVNMLVKDDVMDLIIVDSVAALTPKAELEGDVGDKHIGLHARLMSQSLRMITAHLKRKSRTTVVFINQTRMKIGVMFGNPETTTGGNALKFYASQRIRTSSMGEIKKGGEKGIRVKVKLRKNKVAMPFGECFMELTGGNGVTAVYRSDPRGKEKADEGEDD